MRPPNCPYGPDCDPSEEPCCDGCASGLGPCYGPGYQRVCLTHDQDKGDPRMRIIRLDRIGDGRVAEGVEFSDGKVILKWLTGVQSIEFYNNITDLRAVREASGRSVVTVTA